MSHVRTGVEFLSLTGGAVLSSDRVYRYQLFRDWPRPLADRWWDVPEADRRAVLFIGLNPSTADETKDDPTIRRCIGFAKTWGYDRLSMANLFALRATNPKELYRHRDPIGPENDAWIARLASEAALVVAAWGTHGGHRGRDRTVLALLRQHGVTMQCLGRTRFGFPKHPLYLAANTALMEIPA